MNDFFILIIEKNMNKKRGIYYIKMQIRNVEMFMCIYIMNYEGVEI